ncbi:MAG: winged helix-turn-helix domain-containing protein [Candidatus Nanohaloarchaea archaeon]
MPYDTSRVNDSETAYNILRILYERDDGSYPKAIAEELDVHASSVSDILKVMRDMGIVERGKRTKAQYYEADPDGIYDLFEQLWEEQVEKAREQDAGLDYTPPSELDDGIREELKEFVLHYLKDYFTMAGPLREEGGGDATIKEMLVDDFYFGVVSLYNRLQQEDAWQQADIQEWLAIFHQEVCPAYYVANRPRYEAIEPAYLDLYGGEDSE